MPDGVKRWFLPFLGSYGIQKATEENMNVLDRLLEQHNMRIQGTIVAEVLMSLKNSLQVLTPLALSVLIASSSAAFADPTYGVSRKEEIHSVLYKIYKQQQKLDLMGKEVAAITAINPNNVTIQQDWAHTLTVATHYKEAVPHWLIVDQGSANQR